MKRMLALAVLAAVGLPAFGSQSGAPYEQAQFDRQPPNAQERVSAHRASGGSSSSRWTARAQWNSARSSSNGSGFTEATGAWSNDWNFVAPAQ